MTATALPPSPEALDYDNLLKIHPWLVEKELPCILSPDSDGLLCGLLMTNILNWKVVGFYDGKALIKVKDHKASDCVFLDMEMLRAGVRSVGQHMLMYNYRNPPAIWPTLHECISMNDLRQFDYSHRFTEKYPFATIHFLLAVLGHQQNIPISESAIAPLLYTDGTFKNLFNYPENCLSWLKFLQAEKPASPLHAIFQNDHYTTHEFMVALRDLFQEFHDLNNGKRGGDKISLTDSHGAPRDIVDDQANIRPEVRQTAEKLLNMLGEKTGWQYRSDNWIWNNMEFKVFSKIIKEPKASEYQKAMNLSPLSLAIIARTQLQFTVDTQEQFT